MKPIFSLFAIVLVVSTAAIAAPPGRWDLTATYNNQSNAIKQFVESEIPVDESEEELAGKICYLSGGTRTITFQKAEPDLGQVSVVLTGLIEVVSGSTTLNLEDRMEYDPKVTLRPFNALSSGAVAMPFQMQEIADSKTPRSKMVTKTLFDALKNQKTITFKFKDVKTSEGEIIPEVFLTVKR